MRVNNWVSRSHWNDRVATSEFFLETSRGDERMLSEEQRDWSWRQKKK